MLSNNEIRKRYNLSKNQLDGLITRFGTGWGLVKDGTKKWTWPDASVAHLEEYLATRRGVIISTVDAGNASNNAGLTRQDGLEIAKVIGEKLSTMTRGMELAIANQAEAYNREIVGLKEEIAKLREMMTPRVERRQPAASVWDGFYRWFFLIPVPDRRRG